MTGTGSPAGGYEQPGRIDDLDLAITNTHHSPRLEPLGDAIDARQSRGEPNGEPEVALARNPATPEL